MSGFGAPRRTATPIPALRIRVCASALIFRSFTRRPFVGSEKSATSNVSPASIRRLKFAASSIVMLILWPVARSNSEPTSRSTISIATAVSDLISAACTAGAPAMISVTAAAANKERFILCAVRKELDLALRSDRCYTNLGIVSMGTLATVPLERRADRVGERPEGQACCHRPAVVSQQHPADPRVALRNPEGELRPRLDACRKEILVRHPHETCAALRNRGAVLEQPAHRQRGSRADGIEDPDAVVLGQPHAPVGEITHVDQLYCPFGAGGCEHVAAARNPAGPVREAVRRIVRPHDEARPHARHPARQRLFERVLAACLERSIALVAFCKRRVFVERALRRELSVCGDTRDEDVVGNGAAQHVCHRPNLLRSIAGWIDDCLEAAAAKRSQLAVAVTAQLFDLGKEVRV